MTPPVQQTLECASCGAELNHVRGTVVLWLRCPDCRTGAEVVLSADWRPQSVVGPAQTRAMATDGGMQRANPGTILDRIEFDVDELGVPPEQAIENRRADLDVFEEDLDAVATLRDCGFWEPTIERYLDQKPSARAVFEALVDEGESSIDELASSLPYARRTVSEAVSVLRKDVGVVDGRPDPWDARRRIYSVAEPPASIGDRDPGGNHDQ